MNRRPEHESNAAARYRTQGGYVALLRPSDRLRARAPGLELWWFASVLLVTAGAAVSASLLARSFALLASSHPQGLDLCSTLFAASCDETLVAPQSWILGMPVAGWGLVLFSTLACLLFLARFLGEPFAAEALLAAWLLTLAGVVTGVVLSIAVLSKRVAFCPLCYIVHAIDVMLLLTVHEASGRSPRQQARLLGAAADWLFRPRPEPPFVRWKLLGLGCAALVAAVTYQWVYVESALRQLRPASPSPDQIIAAYRDSPPAVLPIDDEDPHLGPLDAPVQLVVFASFECPACRAFAPTLSQLHEEFGSRLLIVFKHYPLSSRCNERLSSDKQPGSCEIAWAAEAARQQGRFWPFHDTVFAAPDGAAASTAERAVREIGLYPLLFEADRRSPATLDRVANDVALGTRLGIPGTPTVFLDGRLVRPTDRKTLEFLIRRQLAERAGSGVGGPDPALGAAARGAGSEDPALATAVVP